MSKSDFLYHAPCTECGSKDNVAVYSDSHGHCFGCGAYFHNYQNEEQPLEKVNTDLIKGEHKPLVRRQINQETVNKFNYQIGKYNGKTVQIANYYDNHRNLVAQKLRYPDKSFQWIGDSKRATLF